MSYQVLALKYRPLLFEEVIAQEHITETLSRAVETGRVAHGYLFAGPRGTGKTTTARILAKALNCIEGPTSTPCNKCPICREITAGSSLDVLEIDAASNTGVDDVRTLRENIRYLPTSGKKRIFIIDEVHRLSGSAFDALLKTLEEPPDHAVFIFATTEPHKVPQTILSRTQRYDFHRIKTTELVAHMKKLAELEKIEVEEEALYLMARKGEGSVRDALSLFDQMIVLSEGKITREVTAQTLGIVDRRLFVKLLEIIAAGKTEPVFELVGLLFDSGADIAEFVNDFIDYLRNLLVQKSASDPDVFLDVSAQEKEALVTQTAYFTEADILRMIQILSELLSELKRGYDQRIFLEICLVRLTRMESSITLQEVIERLNRLATAASVGQPAGTSSAPASLFNDVKPASPLSKSVSSGYPAATGAGLRHTGTPESGSGTPPATDQGDMTLESGKPLNLPRVQMNWKKFLDALKNRSQMLASMLAMARVRSVVDNKITVAFSANADTNKQVAEKSDNYTIITDTLREFFKLPVRAEFILLEDEQIPAAGTDITEKQPVNADDLFEKDPELKKMVEQIDGEIISRRKTKE
jgi:DNA polymerase-3 subunit gamma/tau